MAENSQESSQDFPEVGKVQKVCKKWSEHEDGVLAYKLQNEEIDFHYGLNRFNRRTARDDLPVAKEIQDEEEKRHQEERMRQLTLLHQRSQEDEKVAQKVYQEILMEEESQKKKAELDDEEIARQMQEKEKRKYERYLEKQRERQLKKEREKIEKRLAKQTEEARLSSTDGVEQVGNAMEALNLQNRSNIRVLSGGQLEDDGDFSDFYVLPDDVSCTERRIIQERQDEELAKLLQEQEHKMSGDRIRPRSMAETQTRQSSPSSDTGPPNRAQYGSAITPHNHSHLVTSTSSSWSRDQEIHSIPSGQLRDQEQCSVSSGHSRDQKRHSVPSARSRAHEPRSVSSSHLRGQERHSIPSGQPRDHESHFVSSGHSKDTESSSARCDQFKDKETNTIPSSFPKDHEKCSGQSADQEPHSVPYSQSKDLKELPAASPVRSKDYKIHSLSFGHSRDQEPHPHSPDHYQNEDSHSVHSGQLMNEIHSGSHRPRDQESHSVSSGHLRNQEQHSFSSGQLRDQESSISSGHSREQEQLSDYWSRDQEGHSVHTGHSRDQETHSLSSGRSRELEQHSVSVQTRTPELHSLSVGWSKEQEHHLVCSGPHRDTRSHCITHSNTTGQLRNVESHSSIPPSGRKRNDYHVCAPTNRWSHQEPISAPFGRRRDQVSNSVPSSRQRDQHYTSHSITHWRDHEHKPNPIIDFEPYFIKPPANLSKDPELHLINSVPGQKRDDTDLHSVPINSALVQDSEKNNTPHFRKTSLPGPIKPVRTSGPHFATQVKTSNSPYTPHSHVTRVTDNSFGSPGRHLNNPTSGSSHSHVSQTRDHLNETEAEEVSRWLTECPVESSPQSGHSRNSQLQEWEADIMGQEIISSDRSSRVSGDLRLPSPSPPGSYHSDDEPSSLSSGTPDFTPSKRQISNPISCTYNIATAIDPTYKRRQHEIEAVDETEPKIPLMLSRSLPVHADTELEWDPGLRGSLRRPKVVHWKHMATLRGGTLEEGTLDDEDGLSDGVVKIQGTQFQPVQGQRRSTTMDRSKKLKKPGPKGNTCKQQ